MWAKHLRNGEAACAAFGKDTPDLRELQLVQVVVGPAGDLALTLDTRQLPITVPARWKERGYDRLQFRMRFAIRDLAIRRQDAIGAEKVSVELENGRIRVVADNGSFELTASFDDAVLQFHPYRDEEGEPLPAWYHQ